MSGQLFKALLLVLSICFQVSYSAKEASENSDDGHMSRRNGILIGTSASIVVFLLLSFTMLLSIGLSSVFSRRNSRVWMLLAVAFAIGNIVSTVGTQNLVYVYPSADSQYAAGLTFSGGVAGSAILHFYLHDLIRLLRPLVIGNSNSGRLIPVTENRLDQNVWNTLADSFQSQLPSSRQHDVELGLIEAAKQRSGVVENDFDEDQGVSADVEHAVSLSRRHDISHFLQDNIRKVSEDEPPNNSSCSPMIGCSHEKCSETSESAVFRSRVQDFDRRFHHVLLDSPHEQHQYHTHESSMSAHRSSRYNRMRGTFSSNYTTEPEFNSLFKKSKSVSVQYDTTVKARGESSSSADAIFGPSKSARHDFETEARRRHASGIPPIPGHFLSPREVEKLKRIPMAESDHKIHGQSYEQQFQEVGDFLESQLQTFQRQVSGSQMHEINPRHSSEGEASSLSHQSDKHGTTEAHAASPSHAILSHSKTARSDQLTESSRHSSRILPVQEHLQNPYEVGVDGEMIESDGSSIYHSDEERSEDSLPIVVRDNIVVDDIVGGNIFASNLVHSFFEGLIVGSSFTRGFLSGVQICTSVFLHSFPTLVGMLASLMRAGYSPTVALKRQMLSYLPIIAGGVCGSSIASFSNTASLYAGAFNSGQLVFLALVELFHSLRIQHQPHPLKNYIVAFFLAGLGLPIALNFLPLERH